MDYKRILTVQDASCVGQCSMTVALPIISACGIETAVIPSAVLSTHTAFGSFTFCDLTEEIPKIKDVWNKENIKFSAVYTGYLGNKAQVSYVKDIMNECLSDGGLRIVDPAMADGGKLYHGFDADYVEAMKELCKAADFILPNITEACLLTGIEYRAEYDRDYIESLISEMRSFFDGTIILTGASPTIGKTGVAVCEKGDIRFYEHEKISNGCHGTGDVYASVFTGALMRGKTPFEAAKIAADFTCECIKYTNPDKEHWYGVKFEPLLGKLIEMLK